jgi:hypothetical protein
MTPTTPTTYNGWTNYETWLTNLWMDNEQGSQEFYREMAQQIIDDITASEYLSKEEEEVHQMADRLKEYFETEFLEDMEAGLKGDLIRAALGSVNWFEIAKTWIEEEKGQ